MKCSKCGMLIEQEVYKKQNGRCVECLEFIRKYVTAAPRDDRKYEEIPELLKDLPQWVCYRNKIPFNPVTKQPAKAGQPETWGTFEAAVHTYNKGGFDGIGFEFNNNNIVGIDLDNVISEDGSISTEASEIVSILDSYTELSPSGRGLHIFVKGNIPSDGRKNGFIEMYKDLRYFCTTGRIYGTTKTINERTEELNRIYDKYFTNDGRRI